MNPGIERTLKLIESQANAKGWDRPPELLIFTPKLQVIRRICPYDELIFAQRLPLQIALAFDIAALGYLSEAWMARHRAKTLADAKAEMIGYEYGDITASPYRIEIRNVYAIDREGYEYQLVRERGKRDVMTTTHPVAEAEEHERLMDVSLRIPIVMRAMMKLIKEMD